MSDEGICGHKCCRDERLEQEAREKEKQEFQLLIEMEQQKRKLQERAADQVRKVKVSVSCHFFIYYYCNYPYWLSCVCRMSVYSTGLLQKGV